MGTEAMRAGKRGRELLAVQNGAALATVGVMQSESPARGAGQGLEGLPSPASPASHSGLLRLPASSRTSRARAAVPSSRALPGQDALGWGGTKHTQHTRKLLLEKKKMISIRNDNRRDRIGKKKK